MTGRVIMPRWMKVLVACALILASASCLLTVVLYTQTRQLGAANCLRIHRLTGTLDQIIINGRASAIRYERDGTITRVQLGGRCVTTMLPGRSCTGRIARRAQHPR
jgi:hypothetical protein